MNLYKMQKARPRLYFLSFVKMPAVQRIAAFGLVDVYRANQLFFFFPGYRHCRERAKVIAIIAVAAGQRICFANRIDNARACTSITGVLKMHCVCIKGYFFLSRSQNQPPSSMLQAIPKCTSNPPQMLRVL